MPSIRRSLAAALLLPVLSACTPTLNWRELALDEGRLRASFPCKPDQARRDQDVGGQKLTLHMAGCEAGDALFVVAYLQVPAGVASQQLLAHWQQQVTHKLRAASWTDETVRIRGAGAQPEPLVRQAQGVDESGRALQLQAVWFAREDRLYHAAIYAPKLSEAMRGPFFGTLELR
jgi:hypothetical protein